MPSKPETLAKNISAYRTAILDALECGRLSWEGLAVSYLSRPPHPKWGRSPAFLSWLSSQDWAPHGLPTAFQVQASSYLDFPIPQDVVPSLSSLPQPFDRGPPPVPGMRLCKWLSMKGIGMGCKGRLPDSSHVASCVRQSARRRRDATGVERLDRYASLHDVVVLDYRLDLPLKEPRPVRCLRCGTEFESSVQRPFISPRCPHCKGRHQFKQAGALSVGSARVRAFLTKGGWSPLPSSRVRVAGGRRFVLCRHSIPSGGRPPCGCLFMVPLDSSRPGRVLPQPPVCPRCRDKNIFRSGRELRWQGMLSSLPGIGRVVPNDRILLRPHEVDLYLPSLSVAVEFNGFWFHSSDPSSPSPKGKYYHRDKSELALSKGVRLYHFWEDCTDGFILSVLAPHLGVPRTRLHARSLDVRRVCHGDASFFYGLHHYKGASPARSEHYGLYDGAVPVSLLSLSLPRSGHGRTAHIDRYCNLPLHTVSGGFRRLLTAFLREHPDVVEVSTYCDRDFSPDPSATVYARNGFTLIGDTGPQLRFYCSSDRGIGFVKGRVYSRQSCMKSRLLSLSPSSDPSMSGLDLAVSLGLAPVWNSGNWSYVYHR